MLAGKNVAMSKRKDPEDLVVCRCESVTVQQIRRSIREDGGKNLNALKKLTRAGMGMCQGRTCARTVELILQNEADVPIRIEPYHARPPVRPVLLLNLAAGAESFPKPNGPVRVVMLRKPSDEKPDPGDSPSDDFP